VIVIDGAERVRSVLEPVYAALGLHWDPRTAGAVEDELGASEGPLWDAVRHALLAEYARRFELLPGELDDETMALARRLAVEHRPSAQAA
jgi:octanoyl-[GcvH]:protein N-octanoyltransferase